MTFSFSKSIGKSNTFEQSTGVEIGASVGIEVKIPFVGATSITISASTSKSWTYGGDNHEEETF